MNQRYPLMWGLLAAALLVASCGAGEEPVAQSDTAPAISVRTLSGDAYEVRPAAGQALWLSFWASWCYPCRDEWPDLNQAQRVLSAEGVVLIAISVNEEATVVEHFLADHPAAFDVMLDPQGHAAAHYSVIGFPTHVLIDQDGGVRAIVRGPLNVSRARQLLSLTEPGSASAR